MKENAPLPSVAMQNDADGHDTETSPSPLVFTAAGLDHFVPSQVTAPPLLSTAAQNNAEAHDTAANWLGSMPLKAVHDDPL